MTRVTGVLLFLFIPLVLVLYLRMPLGVAPSLLLGVGIMLAHRFAARPFLERHVADRCFWCGADAGPAAVEATFASRGKTVPARACSPRCGSRVDAFARFTAAARPVLAAMILVPVFAYLANGMLWIAGRDGIPPAAARWMFKAPIALAVVGASFLYPLGPRLGREPAVDFPVHNLFLLGVGNTLWVFRVVGLWWLAEGAFALGRALGA